MKCNKLMKMEKIGGLQNSLQIKLVGNEIEMFDKGSTLNSTPFMQELTLKPTFLISSNTTFYMHHWVLYVIKIVIGGHSPLKCKRM